MTNISSAHLASLSLPQTAAPAAVHGNDGDSDDVGGAKAAPASSSYGPAVKLSLSSAAQAIVGGSVGTKA